MAEVTLQDAAQNAYTHLYTLYRAGAANLRTALLNFAATSLVSFPEPGVNNHPVANWMALIAALATDMSAVAVSPVDLEKATQFVYRVCWLADYLESVSLITSAQATALLAAYNVYFP